MGQDDKGSVGFIGIGTMGREMVLNLLKAGHAVRAFDLNENAVTDVAKDGAVAAENPADAARGADNRTGFDPDVANHPRADPVRRHG